MIQTRKHIRSKTTNQIMIVSMLQNLNHRYSNHYSIIKFVGFEPIYYTINLSVVSSSMFFNEFLSMFTLMYYSFESIKLFYFQKNKLYL